MMRAMQLDRVGEPLRIVERPIPIPRPGELLIEVAACGICRTDLHIVDGEIHASLPVIPGHEVVGRVAGLGSGVSGFALGQRVGVPWLGGTCGHCFYCLRNRENLCDQPVLTGFNRNGGFATHMVSNANYCFAIPERFDDVAAAPLLCAGLIGYRSFKAAGEAERLGLYGFGTAAHILAQLASYQGRRVFAFTKPGDSAGQAFARSLGAAWAGGSDEESPEPLDAAIIFAPVGALVPVALRQLRKGGRLVCAGIYMSDIPSFAYADLWGERSICSVANLTRGDGVEFMALAADIPFRTTTTAFPLVDANRAMALVREGQIEGAAVLVP